MVKKLLPNGTDEFVTGVKYFSHLLTEELLEQVNRPGQYLGNEWGAARRPWDSALVHLVLAFPDLYELGMSNFGQRILYQIVNNHHEFLADRAYAPGADLEKLLRKNEISLWGWESRFPIKSFELIGFSLQYELTYTNVLNMLELSGIPVLASMRQDVFPLVFGGGPSAVNPEPMYKFLDFFIIGDGEEAILKVMEVVRNFKQQFPQMTGNQARQKLLYKLATTVSGVYVPSLYKEIPGVAVVKPCYPGLPERIMRQVQPLNDLNQPAGTLIPYLSLVHDRQVLEVRRGCDRGCRFCQPGYTSLPVRERSSEDVLKISRQALDQSGQQEYSMLSLCVSDYTVLHDTMKALNQEHAGSRASLSFPSQRADRMNLSIAEELKMVRKSGITLAPEAGTERLRAVINKGLNHDQIISAIGAAYQSGWNSVKLYFMIGLPTETDEDLDGIVNILKEATDSCKRIRQLNYQQCRFPVKFTCTISNTIPKPFTPFQWYGQINPEETLRRQQVLLSKLKASGLRNVTLNFTKPQISLLEAVISRGGRKVSELIYQAWRKGAVFDAWDDKFQPRLWHEAAEEMNENLETMACLPREVGSRQPWNIVSVGLADWWLVKEWQKAMSVKATAPCTEHTCHACGVCTELKATHLLAKPSQEQLERNPFVKELAGHHNHPSLFFAKPLVSPPDVVKTKIRFEFTKTGELRFIAHLDLQHLLVRAARRAGINLVFTEGFNPSPRLSLAISLPLFQESNCEVGEIELAEDIPVQKFMERMNRQLPIEVRLLRAKNIAATRLSLASQVGQANYCARLPADTLPESPAGDKKFVPSYLAKNIGDYAQKIEELLASKSLMVSCSNGDKTVRTAERDIRSGIFAIKMVQLPSWCLQLSLAAGAGMHIKPADVLNMVDPEVIWRVTRTGLASLEGVLLFDLP